jgi:hypothetical protein
LRLAPTERMSAINPGSADSRPASMLSVMGKKAMTTISAILGISS